MKKEGKRIIRECVDERTYTHRSKNLYDSYGYGVYRDKNLVATGFLGSQKAKASKKWYGKEIEGRTEIMNFLRSEYTPNGGLELVVAAAMPYAKVLEEGLGRVKKKYKVIAMSYDKLVDICPSFGKVRHFCI